MDKPFYKDKSAWIFTILLIIAAIAVFHIARSFKQPRPAQHNIGSISTGTSAKSAHHDGRYVSFDYPSNYKLEPPDPQSGDLENFSLTTLSAPIDSISISVTRLPSGNLNDASAYSIRTQDPNRYSLSSVTAGAHNYPVFTDSSGGYQKTAFALNDKTLVTVSLSSVGGEREQLLDSDLETVLAHLTWH
ncbi:MAG TPA: hypothetical protein VG964_02395 [Candidatus Saccharimonadales bacterium]|nr:hypothetical protein [Candidatus Saccharimonadales bacterium]